MVTSAHRLFNYADDFAISISISGWYEFVVSSIEIIDIIVHSTSYCINRDQERRTRFLHPKPWPSPSHKVNVTKKPGDQSICWNQHMRTIWLLHPNEKFVSVLSQPVSDSTILLNNLSPTHSSFLLFRDFSRSREIWFRVIEERSKKWSTKSPDSFFCPNLLFMPLAYWYLVWHFPVNSSVRPDAFSANRQFTCSNPRRRHFTASTILSSSFRCFSVRFLVRLRPPFAATIDQN